MECNFLKFHKNNDPSIKEFRTSDIILTVTDENNQPLVNQEIEIAQINHKFLFGSNGFRVRDLANDELDGENKITALDFNKKLLDMFNFITLPFYWGRFEPKKGFPDTQRLLNTAKWFTDRGCIVKGHPLCWHTATADWLLEMSNQEILHEQISRIQREVRDFKGLINMWDVINEAVIMPIFDKYDNGITRICSDLGRIKIIRKTFEAAREYNPQATLVLNDFDYSTAYEILIEGCLESGIKIDVIGIQSHMHQGYWGVEKTLEILDRYSRFNLPIHFSETTLVSGKLMPAEIVDLNDYKVNEWPTTPEGEARQAEEAVQFYKTLFSHPKIEAITWWDIADGGWLKAPSGLIRSDYSLKPSYNELYKLIKDEWWTGPVKVVTDREGKIYFNGFLGEYSITSLNNQSKFNLLKAGIVKESIIL